MPLPISFPSLDSLKQTARQAHGRLYSPTKGKININYLYKHISCDSLFEYKYDFMYLDYSASQN